MKKRITERDQNTKTGLYRSEFLIGYITSFHFTNPLIHVIIKPERGLVCMRERPGHDIEA